MIDSKCIASLLFLPLILSCVGELQEPVSSILEDSIPEDAILLDGFSEEIALDRYIDLESVSGLVTSDGDFLSVIEDKHLFIEQNDDGALRISSFEIIRNDGSIEKKYVAQKPVFRSGSDFRNSFFRHYAVGYSYDGVYGSDCDLSSVRCQVINKAVLDYVQQKEMQDLLSLDYTNSSYAKSSISHSVVEYIQNSNFSADGEAEILMFGVDAVSTCHVFEDGTIDKSIIHEERLEEVAHYILNAESIRALSSKYPNLLTSSFRHALAKLNDAVHTGDIKIINDFIDMYGSHIVVASSIGARLSMDVQIETSKIYTMEEIGSMNNLTIATLFNQNKDQQDQDRKYEILKNSKCRIDVSGGDITCLDKAVDLTYFNNDGLTASMLEEWTSSIRFDKDDIPGSNVELIDLEYMPIWDIVPDETLCSAIEDVVRGNAAQLQTYLGNRNFINVVFPASFNSVRCRVGNDISEFDNPSIVEIIAANRHVATVCKEYVPEIDWNSKVSVAYPIYEGKIKMNNGLCIHEGRAYNISWSNGNYVVTMLADNGMDGNIYMFCGALYPYPIKGTEYQKGHPILGCERPGGISIEGELQGEMVKVFKHFRHFYLENKNEYDDLTNWSYSADEPEEASSYPQFFPVGDYSGRMVRDDGYVYFYNTLKIGYVD